MRIPKGKSSLIKFVREVTGSCLISQTERINRGMMFTNYAMSGSENPSDAALFNKTFAYLDDLESLLYSPVSLRFNINDPDIPNLISEAKGRAAAAKLRALARQSDTDSMISEAVWWALVKGKTLVKQMWKREAFAPALVQPEAFGVLHENYTKLDEDMEAFTHSMLLTQGQFLSMIWNRRDKDELERKAKRYLKQAKGPLAEADGAQKQVIVGGLYPFQPAGSNTPNKTRGIVDWMQAPSPMLSPKHEAELLQFDETWIWDHDRSDWATFQTVGDEILLMGKDTIYNAYAYNPGTLQEDPTLKGKHPFHEFCPNRIDGYFWGRSEIVNIALLQECMNARINGINVTIAKQEDPPKTFIGGTGVNQNILARLNKPGGYYTEGNPNAKVQDMAPKLEGDRIAWIHEIERMFDEMAGLPPLAKGRGESGVRSQGHAETLVRMFSPRFKDRALLVERDVEGLGGSMLDLGKCHLDKRMIAWVDKQIAGAEGPSEEDPLIVPPVKGQVPIYFTFADLDDDMTLSVDAHSSSPAFSEESKALIFTLVKLGGMSVEDALYHLDAPDPEELAAGAQRRQLAKAEEEQEEKQIRLISSGNRKK